MPGNLDRRSAILSVIGVLASVAGICAFMLPWHGDTTGLDLAIGTLGDLPSAIQVFMPAIALVMMVFILAFSIINLAYRREKIPGMAFASWSPYDTKMMFDGGIGLYLMVIASCLYIFAGIAVYMVRDVPQS